MSPLASEMAAALRLAFASLRKLIAADDPTVALRAVAELTKLVGVCARHKIDLSEPAPAPAPPPVPPTEPKPEPPQPQPAPRATSFRPIIVDRRTPPGHLMVAPHVRKPTSSGTAATRAGPPAAVVR